MHIVPAILLFKEKSVLDNHRNLKNINIDMETDYRFEYKCIEELPKLAWCLRLEKASSNIYVIHGSGVEIDNAWFCEGAWSNSFDIPDFDQKYMIGTGVKTFDNSLLLVSPDHTLDRILLLKKNDQIFASNSLPFLLSYSREKINMNCLFYDAYWTSIKDGLKYYKKSILTENENKIYLYYASNIKITKELCIFVEPKKESQEFTTYNNYKNYIIDCAKKIVANAGSEKRLISYSPLATLSTGYDSPASAVIAKYVGCNEGVTFNDSRDDSGNIDCGTEIANYIGINVKEFSRLNYKSFNKFPEIENSGGPNEFLSFGNAIREKILFTGYAGDTFWDKNCNHVSKELIRAGGGGGSVTEYRLRTGFFQLPIPFIAADNHPSIHQISNSKEMMHWSTKNLYDRPIARRLVEEAWVPRALFGQLKKAAGVVVTREGIETTMSEGSIKDFNKFYEKNWLIRNNFKLYSARIIKFIVIKNRRLSYRIHKYLFYFNINLPRLPIIIPRQLLIYTYGYLGRESMLFHWGVDKLVERYNLIIHTNSKNHAKK